jgi:hypothetical protein
MVNVVSAQWETELIESEDHLKGVMEEAIATYNQSAP